MDVDVEALIRHCGTVTVPDGLDRKPLKVLGWQRQWIRGAFGQPGDTACSISRSGGKTTIASALADSVLTGPLKQAGAECIIVSSSFNQSLIAFRQLLAGRKWPKKDFRIQNSPAVAAITCRQSGAMVRVIGSDPKRAHGLIPSLIIADEPAQWPPSSSDRMIAALRTSLGKRPGSRLLAIGTRPAGGDASGHWFASMLSGTAAGYVQCHAADPDDDPTDEAVWHKANPSLKHFPHLLERMRLEIKDAVRSPQLMAGFKALRLNMGTDDTVVNVLLDAETWRRAEGDVPRSGPVIFGLDAGGTAALSCVVALWPETGRVEALGCFGEEPPLPERAVRDGVPGVYEEMERRGELILRGTHVSDVAGLLEAAIERFGVPACLVADKYREGQVREYLEQIGFPRDRALICRRNAWIDGSDDIYRTRKAVLEGRVRPVPSLLMRSAMAECRVQTDQSGNCRIAKNHSAGRRENARTDAAEALVIAVGEASRSYRGEQDSDDRLVMF